MKEESRYMNTYHCLGCGKEYHTYKEWPDGWICLDCRPTTKIIVKCSECGTDVPVSWGTYTGKDPNIPWRCRSCNDKYRNALYESKSEEEKKAFVESQIARTKKYYANMTAEEREANKQKRKDGWNKRRSDGTAEKVFQKMKEGRKKWIDSMDSEKYSAWRIEIAKKNRSTIEADPESHNASLIDKMKPMEQKFADVLRNNSLFYIYQYPSITCHPDFDKLFPSNPVLKREFVDPTHLWDFAIKTADGIVLIDVDGSIHNPAVTDHLVPSSDGSMEYNLAEYQKFRDSQRPYQTDGLPAYVVQAFSDTLDPDTPVININTGEKMKLPQLLAILEWKNMTDKEKAKAFNG